MAYAKYNRSAVDVISPMLTINQQAREDLRYKEKDFWDKTQSGLKQIGDSISTYMRHKKIAFIGDNELEKLKQELAEARAELESVQNQMRVIKAEDLGSLDTFANTPTLHNAEQDVNAYDVDGGRFASNRVDTYDSASSYEVPTEFDTTQEYYDKLAKEAANRQNINARNKYKIGSKAFGGV